MAEVFPGANPFKIPRAIQNVGGVRQATISGAETWTVATATIQVLDGGLAGRTITLPTVHPGLDGLQFHVYNAGATNDLILSDGSTVVTIVPGDWAIVVTEGTDWILAANSGSPTTTNADSVVTYWGTGNDIGIAWDGTRLNVTQALANSEIRWGVDGAGIDQMWYGDTASTFMTWDQSADSLIFADNARAVFGTGSDIAVYWDATDLRVTQAAPNSSIKLGVDGAGIDLVLYGDTASAACTWDQSADSLILSGVAKIKCQTIAAATGAAIPVTHSGSFPITQNGAETNTLADPTFLGQWLSIFVDTDTSGARVITAASRINQAANTTITLTEVGDFIKLEAITIAGALKWQVVANDGATLS